MHTHACRLAACPGGTINICIVTPERDRGRLLCTSCGAGGEGVKAVSYVGQKKRRALDLSSNQTLMGVGLELVMSCGPEAVLDS